MKNKLSTANLNDSIKTKNNSQKNELQEKYPQCHIEYKLVREDGFDINKTFEIEVYIDDLIAGCGTGKRKKDAEQEAAKDALQNEIPVKRYQRDAFNNIVFVPDINYNYKSKLQEMFPHSQIRYKITKETGLDHVKTFDVDVHIDGILSGSGTGKRKKDTEQNAAKDALENLRN